MKSGVGIDISNGSIIVAAVRGSKGLSLDTLVVEQFPVPEEEETQKEALGRVLRNIWRDNELFSYPVTSSIQAQDCIMRRIVVPFKQEEKIRSTIKFEAENYLHACSLDDVVIDFLKVDEIGDKSCILLAAGNKDTIRNHLDILKIGGVDPENLDLDVAGLFNALVSSNQFRSEGTSFVIDIGANSVRMLLINDGKLRKIRCFRISLDEVFEPQPNKDFPAPDPSSETLDDLEERFAAIDMELARSKDTALAGSENMDKEDIPIAVMDDKEYDSIKNASQEGEEENTNDIDTPERNTEVVSVGVSNVSEKSLDKKKDGLSRLFERILAEIQRTFSGEIYRSGVDSVCITGIGKRLPGIRDFFADSFDTEVEFLDLSAYVEASDEEAELLSERGAVAFGLALRSVGQGKAVIDFRKDDFRFERRYERLKVPMLFTGLLLFCILFFNVLFKIQETKSYSKSYENILALQKQLYYTTFGEDPKGKTIQFLVKQKTEKTKKFRGEGKGMMPNYLPFLELLEDLGQAVKKSGVPNLIWMKIEVRPEIPKDSSYSAGSIAILADDGASAVSKIKESIIKESKYFIATKPATSPHKASGRTLCSLNLQYKGNLFKKQSSTKTSSRKLAVRGPSPNTSKTLYGRY